MIDTNWMNPLNKILFKAAIKGKQDRVKIRDGREFVLQYRQIYDKIEQKKIEKVWIKPAQKNQFAPCGWFSVQKFLRDTGAYAHEQH